MIVLKSIAGEYFGIELTEQQFDSIPPDSHVMVSQVCPFYSDGVPELKFMTGRKFVKSYLQKTGESEMPLLEFDDPESLQSLSEEEFEMSTKRLIAFAAEGQLDAAETYLSKLCHRAVQSAIRVAERKNEFLAIPQLQELQSRYKSGESAIAVKPLEKDARILKISRTDKCPIGVWDAILAKVKKVGNVQKMEKNACTAGMSKSEGEAFVKAVQKIAGLTVEG